MVVGAAARSALPRRMIHHPHPLMLTWRWRRPPWVNFYSPYLALYPLLLAITSHGQTQYVNPLLPHSWAALILALYHSMSLYGLHSQPWRSLARHRR